MPLYNGSQFVADTVKSILGQTLSDIELIIVNDGSVDQSRDIVQGFGDPRIVYTEFANNLGMAHARNRGIEFARADIVAMTDQDDISHLRRLATQAEFLLKNPSVALVGTWVRHFGERTGLYPYCTDSSLIRIRMLGNSQFCHPSIAFRRSLRTKMKPFYDQEFAPTDDYRMLCQVCADHDVANIPMELLRYRAHSGQESTREADVLLSKADRVRIDYLKALFGMELSDAEEALHAEAILPRKIESRGRFTEHVSWFEDLANHAPSTIDKGALGAYFASRLVGTVCRNIELFGARGLAMPYTIPFDRTMKFRESLSITKALIKARLN